MYMACQCEQCEQKYVLKSSISVRLLLKYYYIARTVALKPPNMF